MTNTNRPIRFSDILDTIKETDEALNLTATEQLQAQIGATKDPIVRKPGQSKLQAMIEATD